MQVLLYLYYILYFIFVYINIDTSITKASATAIMNLAKECKKMRIIDLSRNNIGDEPFNELPYTYTEYPCLEKLIIDSIYLYIIRLIINRNKYNSSNNRCIFNNNS